MNKDNLAVVNSLGCNLYEMKKYNAIVSEYELFVNLNIEEFETLKIYSIFTRNPELIDFKKITNNNILLAIRYMQMLSIL